MEEFNLMIFVPSLISALIVAGVAYYFFKSYNEQLQTNAQIKLRLESRKETLPVRIQAFERLTLFIERIALVNLLNRVKPISNDKQDYENLLIRNIDQEYEHNLVQQLYVSDECWGVIKTAKNSIINKIRKTNTSDQITNAYKLKETLLLDLLEQNNSVSDTALQYIKRDMRKLF